MPVLFMGRPSARRRLKGSLSVLTGISGRYLSAYKAINPAFDQPNLLRENATFYKIFGTENSRSNDKNAIAAAVFYVHGRKGNF